MSDLLETKRYECYVRYIGTKQLKHRKIHRNLEENNWTNLGSMRFCLVELCDLQVSQVNTSGIDFYCLLCFPHNYMDLFRWNMEYANVENF